ncbi:MAG: crossover junction endodeoxyribonuclease RuvC [Candidatus Nealsonbacteria bacterium]|nr:crossover junction endodeoxyribonuclease RuvC [Candidatus Nealsonbacteria bacterium]
MIIIGIDPGSAITGYGVLKTPEKKNGKPEVIDFGCIITNPKENDGDRLKKLSNDLTKLIEKYKPKVMAVERLFFFKNLTTVMPVSQAKGVILLTAAKKKIPVYEFTPLQVKMAITGYGRAEKKQVQKMTEILLDLKDFDMKEKNRKKDDASDALGVALCYHIKSNCILS